MSLSGLTFESALEAVVLALESDTPLDREQILAQYPQWADDLNEFMDNWLEMERRTVSLATPIPNEVHLSAQQMSGRIGGDYELLELIGSGGMGVVYRARQISLGRIVALKMVLNTARDKTRFKIEAEAAASLHHANIIAIHEIGEFEGQPFLSMQYVPGGTLQEYLEKGPMNPKAAAVLVRTIAQAVHYAHQRGVLHRDLKPANVLLDADHRPYVSDFGLAKQMGNSVELTRSGAIIGTPGYMAPEQAMGQVKSITIAADVYGLGAILYMALTGEAPFKSDSDLLTLRKVIEEPPISPRIKSPGVDRNLETICLKCLEKSPASRYGSARQLAEDLSRYLRGEPVQARPVGFLEKRWRWCVRNPTLAAISFFAGTLVAALVLISLSFAWREYDASMMRRYARLREAAMGEAIDLARVQADSNSRRAQQAIADLYTTNGLWAARTDLQGESLLWFAKSAQANPEDEDSIAASKVRCLSWLQQCPHPTAVMQLAKPLDAAAFQQDWLNWQLSTNRAEVMFKSAEDFGIWQTDTDEVWRPSGQDLPINAGCWSKDGRSLVLASASGQLTLIDASTKATRASVRCDEPLSCMAFSNSGRKLFACTPNQLRIFNTKSLQEEHSGALDNAGIGLRVSEDDGKVAVILGDSRVTVYDLSAGSPRAAMQVPCVLAARNTFAQATAVEFSADAKRIFVRSEDRRLHVYDTESGESLGAPMTTGSTSSIAIAPNRLHCASGGEGYVRVQSVRWQKDLPSFVRHDNRLAHLDTVNNILFAGPDLIATSGRDRLVQLWKIGSVRPSGTLFNERAIPLATLVHTDDIVGLLSDHAERLVTVQRDGLVKVWQLPKFDAPGYKANMTKGGTTIKSVGEDRWLVAGSTFRGSHVVNASLRRLRDGVVVSETPLQGLEQRGHLLDTAVAEQHNRLVTLHAGPMRSTSTFFTTDNSAGSIQVWDLPNCRPLGPPITTNAEPRSVSFHPSKPIVAVLLVNKDVWLIDTETTTVLSKWTSPTSQVVEPGDRVPGVYPSRFYNGLLQISPDERMVFTCGLGKGIEAWDWQLQRPAYALDFAADWCVSQLAISPSGDCVAISSEEENKVVLFESTSGRILSTHKHADRICSIEFSPTGKELLTACVDGRARIIALSGGKTDNSSIELFHNKKVLYGCYSTDGNHIATLTSDMRVYVWRVRDRQWLHRPMLVPEGTQKLLYPDTNHVVTMGSGEEMCVLDLGEFQQSHSIDLDYVTRLGELLASTSIGDRGIVNLTSAEWLSRWEQYRSILP